MDTGRDLQTLEVHREHARLIEKICRDFQIDSLSPQLIAVNGMLHADNLLDVVILGEFKAGKSSFINDLIGRDLMPVAVLPVTAVTTCVRRGLQDQAEIVLLNGQITRVSPDRISEFITEQKNPENVKHVDRVDVELSDLPEYTNIRFVDTPGLGSVFKHNTLAARQWLPRAGVALLAVSVEHPLSEDDVALLQELVRYTSEIAILITKADLVSSQELSVVVGFVHSQVRQRLGRNIRVMPFSIRPGFESHRRSVRDYLLRSLADQTGSVSEKIIGHKLRTLLVGCREYLSLALSAARTTLGSQQDLRQHLSEELRMLSSIQNEVRLLLNDLSTRLQTESAVKFQGLYSPLLHSLQGDLRTQMGQWKGNLAETSNAFRLWAEGWLIERLEPISTDVGLRLSEQHLNFAQESFTRMVRAFQDRLSHSVEEALGIKFQGAKFEARIINPGRPDVRVGQVFDTPLETIWFLIPMRLFRPWVNHHFLGLLPWEVEKNLYRLASQWSEAITRTMDDLAQQVETFMENELMTIEKLLNHAPDRRAEIEGAIAILEEMERSLPDPPSEFSSSKEKKKWTVTSPP